MERKEQYINQYLSNRPIIIDGYTLMVENVSIEQLKDIAFVHRHSVLAHYQLGTALLRVKRYEVKKRGCIGDRGDCVK